MASDELSKLSIEESLIDETSNSEVSISTQKSQASSRKLRAEEWIYTRTNQLGLPPKRDDRQRPIFQCAYCTTYENPVVGNFRKHLEKYHPEELQQKLSPSLTTVEQMKQAVRQGKTSQLDGLDSEIHKAYLDPEAIKRALLNLIAVRRLPFRMVEWPEFHTLLQLLNPHASEAIPKSHSSLPPKLEEFYSERKDIVRSQIQDSISPIHVSLDVWTSPNRHLLLGVCGHFVERHSLGRRAALLGLKEIANHTAAEQLHVFFPVMQDFRFVRQLGAIIGDNASSNDKFCRDLAKQLQDEEQVEWDSKQRIRCIGHIINLIVQAFLFAKAITIEELETVDIDEVSAAEGLRTMSFQQLSEAAIATNEATKAQNSRVLFRRLGPMGKLHNIVVHIRSSGPRTKQFRNSAGRLIPLDNRTRWNSWFTMLQTALQHEGAITQYLHTWYDDLKADHLSPKDWKELRTMSEFLGTFQEATLRLQGKGAHIHEVLPLMACLQLEIATSIVRDLFSFIREVLIRLLKNDTRWSNKQVVRLKECQTLFDKYWNLLLDNPVYSFACILRPNHRSRFFEAVIKDGTLKDRLELLRTEWHKWKSTSSVAQALQASYEPEEVPQVYSRLERRERQLGWYAFKRSRDEWDDYINSDPHPIEGGVFEWWTQEAQRVRWPCLSQFALEILSIPAMSDRPEQVFSGARRTVSWERAQLGPQTIEWTECLKDWNKLVL